MVGQGLTTVRENPVTWVGALGSIFLGLAGVSGGYLLSLNDKVNNTISEQKIQSYIVSDMLKSNKEIKDDVKEIKELLLYRNLNSSSNQNSNNGRSK